MRYNLSRIMKKAHEIKSEDSRNVWSECLKMAWHIEKTSSVFDIYDEEFIPTRRQIGVIYRNFKMGTLKISQERISDIYDQLDEYECKKENYGFSYASDCAGGLRWVSRAINAIFDGNLEAAEIILR